MAQVAQEIYTLFWNYDLSEEEAAAMLANSTLKRDGPIRMRRRQLGVLCAFLLLLGSITAMPARAAAVTDTITVSIGYLRLGCRPVHREGRAIPGRSWTDMFGGALDTYLHGVQLLQRQPHGGGFRPRLSDRGPF